MHCTSPGAGINGNRKSGGGGAIIENNGVIVDVVAKVAGHGDYSSNEKIFDDPSELVMIDDWSSPVHIPRSRSWLCCPNRSQSDSNNIQNNITRTPCEYSLITDQPKSQSLPVTINISYYFFFCYIIVF